jgi:hypothetical protein
MKSVLKQRIIMKLVLIVSCVFWLSSCATIVGGSKYFAHVRIQGQPDAGIYVQNRLQGRGDAVFQVRRKDANKFSITVKKDGCEDQSFNYRSRTFRGWALVGSILTFGYVVPGTPLLIPYGTIIDIANGSYWKPSIFERGVTKMDYKHYAYNVEYTGCKTQENKQVIIQEPKPSLLENAKSKADRIREMKKLFDDGILTQEEYNKEKAKILDEK